MAARGAVRTLVKGAAPRRAHLDLRDVALEVDEHHAHGRGEVVRFDVLKHATALLRHLEHHAPGQLGARLARRRPAVCALVAAPPSVTRE